MSKALLVEQDALLRRITTIESKISHAHTTTCLAIRLARHNLEIVQAALNAAEDAIRATAESTEEPADWPNL